MINKAHTIQGSKTKPRGRDALEMKPEARGLSSAEIKNTHSSGKVIRLFTVEITDASSAPELYANSSNPYTGLSDDERVKEFDSIFGLLLAESYKEAGKAIYGNKNGCKEQQR